MQNKIMIFLVAFIITGIVIVGGTTLFLTSQKDDSKVAEVITQETDPQITKEVVTKPEEKEMTATMQAIKSGTFNYLDPLHYGEGKVEVIDRGDKYKIKMLSDFKSADAPDPYIYLSSSQDFKDRAVNGVDTSKTINLGKLKSFAGEQEYFVSKSDFESHDAAVIIWCKQFGVQISRADLK